LHGTTTLESYPIAIEHPLELIEGVAMDIEFTPFETFDELYVYCYKVASVVGLMTSEIFGYSDPAALRHAIDLGIAMQLTNILRDIGEDVDRGRIYIPLEDLERFGYSHEEFMQKTMNEKFRRLMQFQIERARNYYLSSDKGIPMLQKESRLAVALSSVNYSNILKSIEENNYDVFSQRAYRSLSQKLLTIPEVWLKIQRNQLTAPQQSRAPSLHNTVTHCPDFFMHQEHEQQTLPQRPDAAPSGRTHPPFGIGREPLSM